MRRFGPMVVGFVPGRSDVPYFGLSAESHREIERLFGKHPPAAQAMHDYLYDEAARIAAEALDPMGWFE